ncbi:MAG: VWA domain-containing protein [Planctomycetaceae bacterium]
MSDRWLYLECLRPAWLAGLLLIPVLLLIARRSLTDFSHRQRTISLVVRCLVLALITLALAGVNVLSRTQKSFVVFAVDDSLSIGSRGRELAADYLKQATAQIGPDQFAVLSFAATARSGVVEFAGAEVSGDNWRRGTSLRAAYDAAAAIVPSEHIGHLVLLTDGNETEGSILKEAVGGSMIISAVPLPVRDDPELQVSELESPAQVTEGQPFRMTVVIDANHEDTVLVELFRGEFRVAAEVQAVTVGENRFYFEQQIDRPTQFTARISKPEGSELFEDSLLDNNTASTFVYAAGKSRVLLVDRVPEAARPLQWALKEESIDVDVRPPAAIPDNPAGLQDYSVVILSNIPAGDLSAGQMQTLRTWVSELGGGFVMLGGDESFGPGGYYRTPIDEILPVHCDFEKQKEKPGLAMILIIDKSGSMGGQKMELAKDAARAAVELLGAKDQIGVIAFDGSPYWISPLTPASESYRHRQHLHYSAWRRTTLYPAMQEAFRSLQTATAKLKHVIVLTDGYSTPGDFEGIAQDMAALRMTVSTVGLGDVDQALLERMAEIGQGRSYFCSDPSSVPQIFVRETLTAGMSAINEEPFLPLQIRATTVLEGIDMDESPLLLGYVVTRPKPTSEVILVHAETQDPLLSWWRFGLGMSVAFTSDAQSRWAADWQSWDGFNRFWAQVVRHCRKPPATGAVEMELTTTGSSTRITINSMTDDGTFLNEAETELTVIDPHRRATAVPVRQTAPGRYEAEFAADLPGTWNVTAMQNQPSGIAFQQSRGMVRDDGSEFRVHGTRTELLQSLCRATGGEFQPNPETVFRPATDRHTLASIPLWPWLLILASVLLVLDVALRRLDLRPPSPPAA